MEWQNLKNKIYYWDGSWRDIYILATTQDDWAQWINFVNENYFTEFYNGQTKKTELGIESGVVFDFWNGKTDLCNNATVRIDSIIIKCYFFTDEEIENDINPEEIKNIEDHKKIIKYMSEISKLLNKTVILTPESSPEIILISVTNDAVKINLI